MNFSRTVCAVSVASVMALSIPNAANAAVFLDFDGSDGVFGNNNITGGTFSDEFLIDTGASPGLLSATISSVASRNAISNIDFTSVTINGTEFDIVQLGRIEFQEIQDLIVPGGLQTLLVSGTSGGNGSYSGTLAFDALAVPEPASWAFMIFGFGAIGGAMRSNRRRQQKANIKLSFG